MDKLEATVEIVKTMIEEGKLGKGNEFDSYDEKYDFVMKKIKKSIEEVYETFNKVVK